jgi:hypothetical protein
MQKQIDIIGRRKMKNWFVPLVAFGFIAGVGITNAETSIEMDLDSWATTSYAGGTGVLEVTENGLKMYASGPRKGHLIGSTNTYNLVDTILTFKWMGYGSGTYAQFCGGLKDVSSKDIISTGPYGGFSTGWSWSGSTVISENTWYYTAIIVNSDHTYQVITSNIDYASNGGNIIRESSGTISNDNWNTITEATIYFALSDPYNGTPDYMVVGDVKIDNINVDCEHATYSPKKQTLTVPFIEIPIIDFLTGQSNGKVELWTSNLRRVSGTTNRFKIISKTLAPITDGSSTLCPATYAIETGTLSIPYIDIPVGIGIGNEKSETDVNVFKITMTWVPISKSFVLQKIEPLDD